MRRSLIAAVLLLVSSGASASETRRYLIATERGVGDREIRALVRDTDTDGVARTPITRFRYVDGFAADLTAADVARISRTPGVRWVEPVIERHAYAITSTAAQVVPYGIDVIRARNVWAAGRGAGTNVVVIDTGVDYTHPELKDIWAGGLNTMTGKNDPMDDNGHGTHVAGTIAAADNEVGVVGVAPQVRLWGIKVLDENGSGSNEKLIQAVDWVIGKKKELGGNWVMNLSLGSPDASTLERAAFRRAVDGGIVVAAAAGNDSTADAIAPVGYPAAYEGVLAVGAVGKDNKIATFSNQGPAIAVVAPGVGILSTVPPPAVIEVRVGADVIVGAPITGSPKGTISGDYVFCGLGRPEEIPASVRGKVALIKRGELKFYEKAFNAKSAGATAVIIFNHDESVISWTLTPDELPTALKSFEWPLTIGISRVAGEQLAGKSGVMTVTYGRATVHDYATYNGTSMATPHVAGTAALIWSLAPTATATAVTSALIQTATDLGASGKDPVFGAGIIDASAAAIRLAPNSGGSPAKPEAGPTTGRPAGMRGRP